MRKAAVRWMLKLSTPLIIILLLVILWDYFRNGSAWMVPLLIAYGVLLLAILLLFAARHPSRPAQPQDNHIDGERLTIAERP